MNIGNWIRRRRGKWHLVESVVAGDAITRCGRRMDRVNGGGDLEVRDTMPLTRMIGQPQLCKAGCDDDFGDGRPDLRHLEDDLSTAPIDATDVP